MQFEYFIYFLSVCLLLGFMNASCFVYLEFLVLLLVSCQLQGFRNPAIFALDYEKAPQAKRSQQLQSVANGWKYLSETFKTTNNNNNNNENYVDDSVKLVIMGDSTGASLILGLLLHIAKPSPSIPIVSRNKPIAVLLVSPWSTVYNGVSTSSSNARYPKCDYVSPKVFKRHALDYMDDNTNTTDPYQSPGLCRSKEWWLKSMPKFGIYITYGKEETLSDDIEELYVLLKRAGLKVKISAVENKVHSRPIVRSFIGRTNENRESGIDDLSCHLARMVLWHSFHQSYEPITKTK